MAPETKEKLSRRIKAMWEDPQYRSRVIDGIEQRARRMGTTKSQSPEPDREKKKQPAGASQSSPEKTFKSPKRRARVRPESLVDFEEVDDLDIDSGTEFFFADDTFLGLTKEDLGIFGSHQAGPVQITSGTADVEQSQADDQSHQALIGESAQAVSNVPVPPVEQPLSISSGQLPNKTHTLLTQDGIVATSPADSVIEKVDHGHRDLLAPRTETGQLPSLDSDAFVGLSGPQDDLDMEGLSSELQNIPVDPLDQPASSVIRDQLENVEEVEEEDDFGYFESNIEILSPTGVEIGSGFVPLPPTGEDSVPTTLPTADFDLSSPFRR